MSTTVMAHPNRWLTLLFGLPFVVAIATELARLLKRARPGADFTADYGAASPAPCRWY